MPRRIVSYLSTSGTGRLGTSGLWFTLGSLVVAVGVVAAGIAGVALGGGPANVSLAAFFLVNALGTFAAAITLVVECFEFVDAWRDWRYLLALQEPRYARLVMAFQHVRQSAFRIQAALVSGALTGALAYAALMTIRVRPDARASSFTLISVGLFTWVTTLRAVVALLDRRDRKVVVGQAERDRLARERGEPTPPDVAPIG